MPDTPTPPRSPLTPLLPGATLGVLGGGQLGRMLALEARRMGYRVHVLDPAADCPAAPLCDAHTVAAYDDLDAARRFAAGVDVITFEFENVPAETLAAIEAQCPVRPSPRVLDVCRHRLKEKTFLAGIGVPVAPFHACRSAADVAEGITQVGLPCILKTAEFGYDGKGQIKITAADQAQAAWQQLGGVLCVLEGFVPFAREVSVIVARNPQGQERCFDVVENEHARHILDLSIAPAQVAPATADAAATLARTIAAELDVVGLIAVEMFLVEDADRQTLVVNELAPRTHNSGHHTFGASATSQFEQQLRAVCGLPLGASDLLQPGAAMANLLGDLWFDASGQYREPDWSAALAVPGVALHLYGKHEARIGRKMGHLTAAAPSPEAARQRVLAARAALQRRTT